MCLGQQSCTQQGAKYQKRLHHGRHLMAMTQAGSPGQCRVIFEVTTAAECTRLSVVGAAEQLGAWNIEKSVVLSYYETGNQEGNTTWRSPGITFAQEQFPLRFKLVANGHRSSPNTRPLIWDSVSRVLYTPPEGGVHRCRFEPTLDNSDTGWVTSSGAGAFQLRVGQPPGSTEPLVELDPSVHGAGQQPFRVDLYEARANDPAVPQGKAFARLTCGDVGLLEACLSPRSQQDNVTFLMNSQSLEALAFRVDVVATAPQEAGRLLARGYVPYQALGGLEGALSCSLLSPDLRQAGTFRAAFLVVTALPAGHNNLGNLQRVRWTPGGGPTLDIGHRGSGASQVQGHSVRENTLLSFQKAAINHSDFIEFDVHVTADGEVVLHHDFEVKLQLGQEVVKLPIPMLDFHQLQSPDFTQYLAQPSPATESRQGALGEERARRTRTLQRAMSSGEDLLRSLFKPLMGGGAAEEAAGGRGPRTAAAAQDPVRWFLADKIATLREAFRRTPRWLGFNIELKYPTLTEVASMRAVFYSRNTFVDEVLKVVLEEGRGRKVIFSTFDADCATLLSLKQPRYPVFFLTCGGTKQYADPRMNSLEAAMHFAISSHLQGVVAEATSVLGRLQEVVEEFHRHGLFLFTFGDVNNNMDNYLAQKKAGVDAVIFDEVARFAKATKKQSSFFNKPLRSPVSQQDLAAMGAGGGPHAHPHPTTDTAGGVTAQRAGTAPELGRLPSALVGPPVRQVLAITPIGSPS
ncbi:hypothetical protein N2152v2_007375 [Parachlorella kessleri]